MVIKVRIESTSQGCLCISYEPKDLAPMHREAIWLQAKKFGPKKRMELNEVVDGTFRIDCPNTGVVETPSFWLITTPELSIAENLYDIFVIVVGGRPLTASVTVPKELGEDEWKNCLKRGWKIRSAISSAEHDRIRRLKALSKGSGKKE